MSDYYRVSLLDSTGNWWDGDPGTLTLGEKAGFDTMGRAIGVLDHISVEIAGTAHYFNPAHIVAIKLGVAAGPPPGREAT